MKKNRLGTSELFVSEVGFGSMSLKTNQDENEQIIGEAINLGVNFFDTADLYDRGMNEESIGKAIKQFRHDIILATKGGNQWEKGVNGWRWNPSKAYLKDAVKGSLKRLNTDYIDLYQLHGGTITDPIDETIEAFEEMVQEGIIRYYGISSIRPNVIKRYLEKSSIVSIMMQYSLLDRRPEEWLELIEKKGISVIARGPVAKGLLSDSYKARLTDSGYLTYNRDELEETINQISDIASNNELSLQQLAIRYVIDHPTVATAIPGASKLEQLVANTSASDVPPLSQEVLGRLKEITKHFKYEQHRD